MLPRTLPVALTMALAVISLGLTSCCDLATDCCDGPKRKVKSVTVRILSDIFNETPLAEYRKLSLVVSHAGGRDTVRLAPSLENPGSVLAYRVLEMPPDSVHLQVLYGDSLLLARGYSTADSAIHHIDVYPTRQVTPPPGGDIVAMNPDQNLGVLHQRTEPSCP